MKPLIFYVFNRPRNNRSVWYKCDTTTRKRINSYLLRVWVALGNSQDFYAAEDREFVTSLINMQLAGMDWGEQDLEKFNRIWMRGRRNSLKFNIIEVRRGESARYDDVRNQNIRAIIKNAATEFNIEWNFEASQPQPEPEQSQQTQAEPDKKMDVQDWAEVSDLLVKFEVQMGEQRAEIERLRAEVQELKSMAQVAPQAPQESVPAKTATKVADEQEAISEASKQPLAEPEVSVETPAPPAAAPVVEVQAPAKRRVPASLIEQLKSKRAGALAPAKMVNQSERLIAMAARVRAAADLQASI